MPRMTPHGFAYVAFREHEQGASSRALFSSSGLAPLASRRDACRGALQPGRANRGAALLAGGKRSPCRLARRLARGGCACRCLARS